MRRFNLLEYYPKSTGRGALRPAISDQHREVSRRFDFDYFDGDRKYGYGGYSYQPRFWTDTVKHITNYYSLDDASSVLDVGCAKGFILKDFQVLLPDATLAGVDVSEYAIAHAEPEVSDLVQVASATDQPFDDNSFELVLSINTVHNLVTVPPRREGSIETFSLYIVQAERRDALVAHLQENGVDAKIHNPIPLQAAAQSAKYTQIGLPKAELQAGRIITLPVHQFLKTEQLAYVTSVIDDFFLITEGHS